MLFINQSDSSFQTKVQKHFESMRCLIWKKIGFDKNCKNPECGFCNSDIKPISYVPEKLKSILSDELVIELLIKSKPENLLEINQIISNEALDRETTKYYLEIKDRRKDNAEKTISFFKSVGKKYFDLLSEIICYDYWISIDTNSSKYNAYDLSEALNQSTCVYCNRNYTLTIRSDAKKSGKLLRPQFDHWYPKEKFPLLALSFYNLIPSCSSCNSSIKGSIDFRLETHVHPYSDDVINKFNYSFEYWEMIGKYSISINCKNDPRISNTVNALALKEIYEAHQFELDDLIKISQAYSPEYLRILKSSFPSANLTDEQIYRFAFGTELNSYDFHKRPFSKFKHDILKELKIIKD